MRKSGTPRKQKASKVVDLRLVESLKGLEQEFEKGSISEFVSKLKASKVELGKFNIFQVLGMGDYEIRHSRMLVWLLDPNANHGLGNIFLNAIVNEIVEANGDKYHDLRKVVDGGKLVSVKPEVFDIDVFLEDKKHKIVLAIENKWNASERKDDVGEDGQLKKAGQLRKYVGLVQSHYEDWSKYYIFLSPAKVKPSRQNQDTWGVLGYENILNGLLAIEKSKPFCKRSFDVGVKNLIQHYRAVVEGRTLMESSEFEKVCMNLYAKYAEVFRYMYEHELLRDPLLFKLEKVSVHSVESCCDDIVLKASHRGKTYVQFEPRFPGDTNNSVHYEIEVEDKKVKVGFHVESGTEGVDTDELKKEIKAKMKGGKEIKKGCYYEICRADYGDESALLDQIGREMGRVYQACEPILRRYDAKYKVSHGK